MKAFIVSWGAVMVAAFGVTVLAGAGMSLTVLDNWYYSLKKPSWQPPDWLFGPAWTLIFIGEATAAVIGWHAMTDALVAGLFIILLLINAVLNILWSYFFFKLKRPDFALFEVGFLWLSIAAPMLILAIYAGKAWLFLLPYLLWVSFAAILNNAIVRLNSPFGEVL
ncbi:MAG: tryptophan-rich sensory protein [Acidocella sp.]|nr:tryptophan-rich sensory protein [Acidocella sp.]